MAKIPGVQKSAPAQAVAVTGKGSVKKGTKSSPIGGTKHPAMGTGSTGPINTNQTGLYNSQQQQKQDK